jgi:hypothetical protein
MPRYADDTERQMFLNAADEKPGTLVLKNVKKAQKIQHLFAC